ncbi:RagB/SusD family nutrient uptake outer membrane protein [Flammeovirga kamogawensis]|uniref:RagB/SusD family nutrient uptake outer membrane protein n=1 Tax=Flammeovirga kamogawensis TaxID=373891 RepID=A0ABX8H1T5_9BACT|nr:RagB/SusD family nutrient uptake outer membrane protein [Flammeovirga kamogawensis]MBB6462621.1 hypothetical protein [Flammeovirga kamogawensis]QWG09634.1 RagB/SusD family nutrient uptake outer membrane protein [Flammeovirga kamogawensis]TRX65148.1 RagB/SusD family nutrient uptake outer membrane protein [Flammeovirga kamogawensis]
MKKYIIISLVFLGISSSCTFLAEDPKVQITTEEFYKTENDALVALSGAYGQMKSGYGYYRQTFITNLFASSDQGTGSYKHAEYFTGTLSATNATLTDTWNQIYISIRDVNNVIAKVPAIDMDEEYKARLIGEARFLRGLHYLNLVRAWGEVPLRLTPAKEGEDEVGLPVSGIDVIYNSIIADLKYASDNCWGLEESRNGQTNAIGRVTNTAARALLAKTYLHIASATRNALIGNEGCKPYEVFAGKYQAYYDSAKVYCDIVIEDDTYALVDNLTNWENLFHASNGNNREFLFDIQNAPISGQGSSVTNLFTPQGAGLSAGNWGGTNDFKSGFTGNNIDVSDTRYDKAIIHEYTTSTFHYAVNTNKTAYIAYDLETNEQQAIVYRVFTSKYIDKEATSDATAQQNWHVIRLADVFLMRAEAVAEIYKNPALANDDINTLRERVDMDHLFDGAGMSMSDFRKFLIRERGVELMGEGHRWFDLTRMGMLEELVKTAFDPSNTGKVEGIRGPEDYVWPIPYSEVASNENID